MWKDRGKEKKGATALSRPLRWTAVALAVGGYFVLRLFLDPIYAFVVVTVAVLPLCLSIVYGLSQLLKRYRRQTTVGEKPPGAARP